MRLLEPRLSRVGFLSARVALISTAIVALVYLVLAAGVVLIVQRNLTARIDSELQQSLVLIASGPQMPAGGFRPPAGGPPGGDRFGPPLIVWTVHRDGSVTSGDTSASLPLQDRHVQGPETISVGGSIVRVEGRSLGDDYVIAGMSMSGVQDATRQFVLAEAIVAPILLLAVFLGALTIGRRVGAPIELARQRQMEFTADASHELRTPLSVIEATTTLALSRDRDAAWYRTAFVRVHAESGRIRRLVEDLLWLARFDATRGQPDAEPVDVAVLAEQAADRFTSLAEARGLSLSLDSGPEPAVVTAPPEWLDRLLGVLLDNACKYSGPSGTVEVVVRTEGNRVRLKVDDSGPGIPPEERKRIFDRFHRATQQSGGAGLGLAIADAVVRVTNGRWDIGSSAAGGASMSVTWPRTLAGARMSAQTGGGAAMPRP
ncbi:MAG TPA: HAMP domain-containing sensor histidine kinase, partial [Candidatus Dormibacteraeota bacterium]